MGYASEGDNKTLGNTLFFLNLVHKQSETEKYEKRMERKTPKVMQTAGCSQRWINE